MVKLLAGSLEGSGALFTDSRETMRVIGLSQYMVNGIVISTAIGAVGSEGPQTDVATEA